MMKSSNTKSIFVFIFFGLIVFFLTKNLLHKLHSNWQKKHFPAPGAMVDIGGYKLHVIESGKGRPSVILEAGFACFSLVWDLVQRDVAQFAHVYSYDRAGLGWSESSPLRRISPNMVQELHTLLETLHAPKPYLLVGHSFGGLLMQLYANTYPDDVYALVLVDSSHELMIEKSAEFNRIAYSFLPSAFQRRWHEFLNTHGMETLSNFTGIRAVYLRSLAKNAWRCIPPEIKKPFVARLLSPQGVYTRGQEMRHIAESHNAAKQAQNLFSNKPLIVISRGKIIDEKTDPEKFWPYLTKAHLEVWDALQNDLATKSSNSTHIIAQKSGHTIVWSEPELIVDAIRSLVDRYHAEHE